MGILTLAFRVKTQDAVPTCLLVCCPRPRHGWRSLGWNPRDSGLGPGVSSESRGGEQSGQQGVHGEADCLILGPDSGCDEVGLKAKRIGPLVLSDHCPRPMCDECTKKAIRMVVGKMQRHYPGQWHQIQVKLASQRGTGGRR